VTPHVDPPAARCELKDGHAGTHRVGLLVWNDPPLLLVGGVEPDLQRESDHWIDGNVYLSGDEPPL
jgi:hypothetical protein